MSRIPLQGIVADIPGAMHRGYLMARDRKQGALDDRVNEALEDHYGNGTRGVLAAHRPDVLVAESQQQANRVQGQRDQWEFDQKKETARIDEQERAKQQFIEMAPSVVKLTKSMLEIPEEGRPERFQAMSSDLIKAYPEFAPIAEQVLADGKLTDQELQDAMGKAEVLLKDAKPTTKMQDFQMAQENPEYAEFLKGDAKAPTTRKRALEGDMLQDEEFVNGQWQPVGVPYNRRENLKPYTSFDPESGSFETGFVDVKTGKKMATGSKPQKEKGPPKLTEGERTAKGYYDRMVEAEKNIAKLGDYDPTSFMEVALGVTNTTKSSEKQLYDQAAADFIRAKLRKESGAVISPAEMEQEYETYFPVYGDSDEVIEQKKQSRMQAMKQLATNAGNALTPENSEAVVIGDQEYSMTDLEYTARKHGITIEELKEQLANAG